ncbi:MAG TPA: hypothetical protein VFY84_03975, partial [Jiangellales bacterium]|nr:hypothetical protein [Jiangellales bacterium]
ISADGLASVHDRMRFVNGDTEVGLREAVDQPLTTPPFDTVTVTGTGEPERELVLPYRGRRLRGDEISRQLAAWVDAGVVEPSCAEAVGRVLANPGWLELSDVTIVAFGAGAEMGPVQSVLRWGGDVVAVDLPRPAIWNRLTETARRYAGRMLLPARPGGGPLTERAGADLIHELPGLMRWLSGLDGRLVLGNYAYADGAEHVRVAAAVDAITDRLLAERPDSALSCLATPTEVYAVPAAAVEQSVQAYESRSKLRAIRRPLKLVSGGRLLERNYAAGADPGICDSLVSQQGPNYALAKRLQRWRATVARSAGRTVNMTVAPPTRTRSVMKNRALAAAYAGAHRFGVEVFEPGTANTLMAALLVHDLRQTSQPREHPWQDEAANAAHGGIWRAAYAPRSALGLAALVGLGGARG